MFTVAFSTSAGIARVAASRILRESEIGGNTERRVARTWARCTTLALTVISSLTISYVVNAGSGISTAIGNAVLSVIGVLAAAGNARIVTGWIASSAGVSLPNRVWLPSTPGR